METERKGRPTRPGIPNAGLRSVAIIVALHAIATALTAVVAALTGAPFVLWYKDSYLLLLVILGYIVTLGVVWDGSLILLGILSETWRRYLPRLPAPPLTVEAMRQIRFFSCGPWPLLMIVATSLGILGTSNITLISLNLLGMASEWHDPFFWGIEAEIIEWVASLPIDTVAWDRLYHSAWAIEYAVVLVLIVLVRKPYFLLHYCVSMVILFYVGRYLGLLNPVMGPAIFKPELFGYLDGSFSETAMQLVKRVMEMDVRELEKTSGVLVGGVSAMPSLHVGMVSLTAYWLGAAKRWTVFFSLPWVLLVWTSTVVLGWHYILDGAGGVVLAAACVWATCRLLKALDMTIGQKAGAAEMPEP